MSLKWLCRKFVIFVKAWQLHRYCDDFVISVETFLKCIYFIENVPIYCELNGFVIIISSPLYM